MESWTPLKVLITEPDGFSPVALNKLRQVADIDLLPQVQRRIDEVINQYEVVIIRLGIHFDQSLLARACRLKHILTPTTGLDHIDLEYTALSGITVISLKGEIEFLESIPSTAEHTWALLLALVRNIPKSFEDVVKGSWDRQSFRGNNLRGKTLGILGLGRVGKQIASFGCAFGMRVIAFDADVGVELPEVECVPVSELFKRADIISIHIPLSDANQEYVSDALLRQSKPGQFLVNTSRGAVWDEVAIYECLKGGILSGVATDVMQGEFDGTWKKSPICRAVDEGLNVIVTPHIAGATYESMHMTEEFVVRKFLGLLQKDQNK